MSPATVMHGLYQYLDGTSMATPHVSGAVAFAAMNFPSETVTQRVQRVLTNADVIPGLQGLVHNSRRLNLQRMVDTDGNGLPDWWEFEFFGHYTGTDPNADPDHDGMSNLAEWIAGTNPTNAASVLRLTLVSATNASGVVVSWSSVGRKELLAGTFHQPVDGLQARRQHEHCRDRAHQHPDRHGDSARQHPVLPGRRGAIKPTPQKDSLESHPAKRDGTPNQEISYP